MFGKESRVRTAKIRLDVARNKKKALEEDLAICAQMPITLGKVLVASERAMTHTDNILDYAAVAIDTSNKALLKASLTNNILPQPLNDSYEAWVTQYKGEQQLSLEVGSDQRAESYIAGIGNIEKGQWYFKVGRTTNFTAGICSGVEAYVNMAGYRTPYGADGKPGPFRH